MIEQLTLQDYQGIYNLEEEDLKKLQEHSQFITNISDGDLKEMLNGTYNAIYESLKTSVATDNMLSSYEDGLDNISPKYVPEEIEHDVYKYMLSIVTSQLVNKSDVVPNDVINELLRLEVISKSDLEENQDIYINYLSTFIPEVKAFRERHTRSAGLTALQRESTTYYLLRKEHEMLEEAKAHSLYCIKQIFLENNELSCDCPSCNSKILLDKIALDYIVFATNSVRNDVLDSYMGSRRGSNCSLLPRIHYCPNCSSGVLLSPYDLSTVKIELDRMMKKGASSFAQESASFGKGTACTTGEIPYSMLRKSIEYLFYCNVTDTVTTVKTTATNEDTLDDLDIISVDFTEIRNAAEQFYKKLIGKKTKYKKPTMSDSDKSAFTDDVQSDSATVRFENNTGESHLTYHDLAVSISHNLSRDYNKLKHQALFSFIFMLNETKLIKDFIDVEKLFTLQNMQKFFSSLPTNAENLSVNEKIDVIAEFSKRYPDKTDSTLQEKLNTLLHLKEELLAEIEERKSFQTDFFNYLRQNIDALSYTKIINLNQYRLADMTSVLFSSEVIQFLDELTDRMIINNLAEEYYPIYLRYGIFNAVELKTTTNLAEDESVYKRLKSMYFKVCDKYAEKTGLDPSVNFSRVHDKFLRVAELSNNGLKPVKDLYDTFRNNDYYKFIKAVDSLITVDSDLLTQKFIDTLKNLLDFADAEIKQIGELTYLDYYLRDFTTDEIESVDMNTKMKLSKITFGLYVPKRDIDETLASYVDRYILLKKTGELADVPHYDFGSKFLQFRDFFGAIIICAGTTGINYSSYVKASFISTLCSIAVEDIDREFAVYLFALNEHMISRLIHNSEVFDESLDIATIEENIRIFQGYYSTFISDFIDKQNEEFNSIMISSNEKFSNYLGEFSVAGRVCDLLKNDDNFLVMQEMQYLENEKSNSQDKTQTAVNTTEIDPQEIREAIISEISEFGDLDLWGKLA